MPTEFMFTPFVSDNDGVLYHTLGAQLAHNFNMQTFISSKLCGGLFPKIIGIIYYYFTNNPFIITLLNGTVAGFSACLFFLINKTVIKDRQIAKVCTLLTILSTAHIVNTSVLIRDSYIVFFIYLSIYLSYLFYKSKNLLYFVGTFLSLYLLYSFRPYAACIVLLGIVVANIAVNIKYSIKNKKIKINKVALVVILLLPFLIAGVCYLIASMAQFLNYVSVDDLIAMRENGYTGSNSDYSFDFTSLYSKFFLLPFIIGYFCLFFAPFPWEWIYVKRLHYIPDMLVLYFLLPSFFKNLLLPFKEKDYLLLTCLLTMIFMFSIYCITLGNSGAIHRLRGPYIPMIYTIAMFHPTSYLQKVLNKIKKWRII